MGVCYNERRKVRLRITKEAKATKKMGNLLMITSGLMPLSLNGISV